MDQDIVISQPGRVAIIGAGAAGLVAAREAVRENLDALVYEASDRAGGVWVYRDEVEDDPLGLTPTRRIHGSLYKSLRTNLPRELMAFRDYPFDSSGGGEDDWLQFPEHAHVLAYLMNFARDFDLHRLIRFQARVESISPSGAGGWRVQASDGSDEAFDAVVICNGHYSQPRVPSVPGMSAFSGQLMHSHNFRRPEQFRDMRVVVFGAGASGEDLAREIGVCAAKVFWCAEAFNEQFPSAPSSIIEQRAAPVRFEGRGGIRLTCGSELTAIDAFIFCTGYHYSFPFLKDDVVTVDDNWVHPLYLDLISPTHPTLAFIGLPYSVIPFPLFEMQAQWFLRRVSGRYPFPRRTEMETAVSAQLRALHAEGRLQRHFHRLGDSQFAYVNGLASQCGGKPLPGWFEPMMDQTRENRRRYPGSYRNKPIGFDDV